MENLSEIVERIESDILKYGQINRNDTVLLGLSGGADSVCLFHILKILSEKMKFKLSAVHVNHSLRGKESDEDDEFAKELCLKSGIEFFSCRIDAENLNFNTGSLEADLREARFAKFIEFALENKFCSVALAHNLDDNIETVLFRFLRGSGPSGLAGIEPVSKYKSIKLIRPLINISKDEIKRYLTTISAKWREDSSNRNFRFTRNKIRNELIPYIEKEYNPNIKATISRCSSIFSDIKTVLNYVEEYFTNNVMRKISSSVFILEENMLRKYPEELQRLIFRKAIATAVNTGYSPEENAVTRLSEEYKKKKRPLIIKQSAGLIIIIKKEGIYFWSEKIPRKTSSEEILKQFSLKKKNPT